MLQFGGAFHAECIDPEVVGLDCCDRINPVTSELRKIRNARSTLVLFEL